MLARKLLQPQESAIVLYTAGDQLNKEEGRTGNWIINVNRAKAIKHLIIYYRSNINTIYRAEISRIEESSEEGRRVIYFENLKEIGSTSADWKEFAETNQNPVRYLP